MYSVTVPPTATDLTTLAAVKLAGGISGTASDTRLAASIARASSVIAGHCKRPLGLQTVAETVYPSQRVPRALVLAFPGVTVSAVTEDGTALTVDTDYQVDAGAGLLWRMSGGARTTWPALQVVVTYTTGWTLPGEASPDLPDAIEGQCIALALADYHAGGRDPTIAADSMDGAGMVRFFDRGSGTLQIDDGMAGVLAPYVRLPQR